MKCPECRLCLSVTTFGSPPKIYLYCELCGRVFRALSRTEAEEDLTEVADQVREQLNLRRIG
jgi:uncharacterized protein (DUF608 family)